MRNLKYKEKNLGLHFYTVKIFVGSWRTNDLWWLIISHNNRFITISFRILNLFCTKWCSCYEKVYNIYVSLEKNNLLAFYNWVKYSRISTDQEIPYMDWMRKSQCATLLKVTLLHGCSSRFLNCTNGTKSRNTPNINTGLSMVLLGHVARLKFCFESRNRVMG